METFLIKALQLVLSLSILVIVHEFGHFILARMFKIKVEKFYLFFDAWFALLRFKPKNSDTEYGIGWLPLGGYVKIAGMVDESMDKEQMAQPPKDYEFRAKPAWQRLLVIIAGITFNFILALGIYSMVIFTWGDSYISLPDTPLQYSELAKSYGFRDGDKLIEADGVKLYRMEDIDLLKAMDARVVKVDRSGQIVAIDMPSDFLPQIMAQKTYFVDIQSAVVDSVIPTAAADKAGLVRGDSIVMAADKPINSFSALKKTLTSHPSQTISLAYYRSGSLDTTQVAVDADGRIGFTPMITAKPTTDHYSFWGSIPRGVSYAIDKLTFYVNQMKFIFTKEGAGSIGGFGAIGNMFPPIWDWQMFWEMTAFLSLVLAFMNFLPIPALDGGHIVFILYEMIAGRKPSDKFMEYAQTAGMVLLFGLLLYANGADLVRFLFK